jgi:hypothetical protein
MDLPQLANSLYEVIWLTKGPAETTPLFISLFTYYEKEASTYSELFVSVVSHIRRLLSKTTVSQFVVVFLYQSVFNCKYVSQNNAFKNDVISYHRK